MRAIALLEETNSDQDLVSFLMLKASLPAIGAWIPELIDARRSGARVQHHVLKMLPPLKPSDKFAERFVAKKADLLKRMGGGFETRGFLERDSSLSEEWWARPYRAEPKPGQSFADRAMALATTLRDLLIIGDPVLVLNPDTVTRPGALRVCARLMAGG